MGVGVLRPGEALGPCGAVGSVLAKTSYQLLNSIGVLNTARIRKETFQGRPYVVAPATMIVPGVLAGNKGPLFYPPDEVASHPEAWNHVPLLAYHPNSGSGRDPEVINKQGIGLVLRTQYDDRLHSECWFDEQRTQQVDNRILAALETGSKIEVSTGLFAEKEPAPEGAIHNGQPYEWVVRNYRPDHLAILPDQTGACSLNDGCGVFNTFTAGVSAVSPSVTEILVANPKGKWEPPNAGKDAPAEVKAILRKVYAAWRDKNTSEDPATKAKGAKIAWSAVKRAGWYKGADGKWTKGPVKNGAGLSMNALVTNEMSYEEWMDELRVEFRNIHPLRYHPEDGHLVDYCYLVSVFDDYVVYMQNGELYRQGYSYDQGSIQFSKDSEKVRRVISYEPIKNVLAAVNTPCQCIASVAPIVWTEISG